QADELTAPRSARPRSCGVVLAARRRRQVRMLGRRSNRRAYLRSGPCCASPPLGGGGSARRPMRGRKRGRMPTGALPSAPSASVPQIPSHIHLVGRPLAQRILRLPAGTAARRPLPHLLSALAYTQRPPRELCECRRT